MYRGILMPLSSDGDTIDFIYGVINWKEVADSATTAGIAREMNGAEVPDAIPEGPVWANNGAAAPVDEPAAEVEPAELFPANDEDEAVEQPSLVLDADAGLADRLCVAREAADAVKNADVRSRSALYRALGDAYDFALAAEAAPEDYAEILEDAGLKAQDRAPMTPVVKLIFGIDYDKTRLTEFAAALSYGRRENVPQAGLTSFLEGFGGGLKAVVAAERRARRPEQKPDATEAALEALRHAQPVTYVSLPSGDEEFVLLVARRQPDGLLGVVAPVAFDKALIERAARKARL
jgi:hypothetical protein